MRKLATLVAGVNDDGYRNDFASTETIETRDNVVQLLRFSIDFVNDPDSIPRYTLAVPRAYDKLELFERFALDNLAGLKILDGWYNLNVPLEKMREISLNTISDERLEERVAQVREGRYQPKFVN